jgi:hypothetical protein
MAYPDVQKSPKRPRAIVRVGRAVWRGMAALDNHWIGDLIGVIILFGLIYLGLIATYVFGGQ